MDAEIQGEGGMREVQIGPQDSLLCLKDCFDGLILHLLEINALTVPPGLVKAILHQESRFNPLAESKTGAEGLGQFTERTWTGLYENPATEEAETDIFTNLSRTIRNLAELWPWAVKHSGSSGEEAVRFTLAGYNLGPGNVNACQEWAEAAGCDGKDWNTVSEVIEPALLDRGWPAEKAQDKARETEHYVPAILSLFQLYAPDFEGKHAEG